MVIDRFVIHVGKTTVYDMRCEKCGYEERMQIRSHQKTAECKQCMNNTQKFEKVSVGMSWDSLFCTEMDGKLRKKRWEEWKKLLLGEEDKTGNIIIAHWGEFAKNSTCLDCKHRAKDWCNSIEVPCKFNPALTPTSGMLGLACGGAGKTSVYDMGLFKSG